MEHSVVIHVWVCRASKVPVIQHSRFCCQSKNRIIMINAQM